MPKILPEHLLLTLLEQKEGVVPEIVRKMNPDPMALASPRCGPSSIGCRARTAARRSACRRGCGRCLTAAEQEAERLKDEYISTEHLFIAIAAEGGRSAGSRLLQQRGITKDTILQAMTSVRGSQRVTSQNPEVDLSGARALRPRPDRARAQGQARSGDRPRRRDPPRDPGAVAPDQEQPGADRRAGRRQDRRRRRAGPAHRPAGRARRG